MDIVGRLTERVSRKDLVDGDALYGALQQELQNLEQILTDIFEEIAEFAELMQAEGLPAVTSEMRSEEISELPGTVFLRLFSRTGEVLAVSVSDVLDSLPDGVMTTSEDGELTLRIRKAG